MNKCDILKIFFFCIGWITNNYKVETVGFNPVHKDCIMKGLFQSDQGRNIYIDLPGGCQRN